MNLRFVEAFVWVARLKSVTRAAEKLFLTQSAVSSRIATLEEELGVPLVDRRDRVFRLTNAGNRFLTYAERFLALQRDLRRELGTSEQLPVALRIGGIETVLHTWLVPLVEELKEKRPYLEFELNVEMTHVLNEQVRRGALDLIFTAAPAVGQGLDTEALPPMDMVFVGPAALANTPPLTLNDLLAREILTFQRGSQPHVALLDALRGAGTTDKRVHTISSISALVKLVESGFGLATLPLAAARELARRHDIAVLEAALPLTPLPLHASFWRYPAAPALEGAIADALAFARKIPAAAQGSAGLGA